MNNQDKVTKALSDLFPDCWFKAGYEWDDFDGRLVWSGEGSEIDGIEAFNHNWWSDDPSEQIWTMGVHNDLYNWATGNNMYWECHDGGTYFLFKM